LYESAELQKETGYLVLINPNVLVCLIPLCCFGLGWSVIALSSHPFTARSGEVRGWHYGSLTNEKAHLDHTAPHDKGSLDFSPAHEKVSFFFFFATLQLGKEFID